MRPSTILASRRDRVLAVAQAHGASDVRVFGSAANGNDRDDSDLDLLVKMPAGHSLLAVVGLQIELEDELGIRVDLCTERELHPALRERILADARPI